MASEGRATIVTGGGSGLGRATAHALGSRRARVLVVDLNEGAAEETAEAIVDAGGVASTFTADVSDPDAVAAYVEACEKQYGGVDSCFNCAARLGAVADIPDYDLAEYEQVMDVNAGSIFSSLKYVIPSMRRRGGGAIVNVSSTGGTQGLAGFSAYVASKHAVIGLTRCAALEVAKEGIAVNAICPAAMDTPMSSTFGDMSVFLESVPVGRMSQPEEVAALATWLLLDAPSFLTGSTIAIDGGFTAK